MTNLKPNTSLKASATPLKDLNEEIGWHLEIPAGLKGRYRLAQLDDYTDLPRRNFPWRPPITIGLSARASAAELPGTWGFGLWNDPFNLSLGIGGGTRRFPAIPNTAWFFSASPENYLSFQEDKPAQGFLAQTFQSRAIHAATLALGSPMVPLLFWPWAARRIRQVLSKVIKEDSTIIACDVTQWQTYTLQWTKSHVLFKLNGNFLFQTGVTPTGPLGLVIWIDNQYAAFPPNGRTAYGVLGNPEPAWIEIKDIVIRN